MQHVWILITVSGAWLPEVHGHQEPGGERVKGNSAISDHLGNCHAPSFDISRFNVLACGNSDFEIKIKEALLIQLERPSLNCQLSHSGSSFLLNVF